MLRALGGGEDCEASEAVMEEQGREAAAKRGDVVLSSLHLSPVFFNNGSAVGPENYHKEHKHYDTNL